jgi:23S rRNA pseudouridine1911/1915/1917 synthase
MIEEILEELSESQEQDEYFRELNIKVDPGQTPLRIDRFLSERMAHVSRSRIQQAAQAGAITVNQKAVKPNYKVRPGDLINAVFPSHEENTDLIPENIPLDIVYEDDDLLVINKQPNLVVHPGLGNHRGTLVNALMWHFKSLPMNEDHRPGLVHRLDKDTTGLMVIAKSEVALPHLAKQFFDRTIDRKYLALVWGDVELDSGKVEAHIGRHSRERMQFEAFPDGSFGKPAITHYQVVERFHYVTLVSCKLETGRTHQIRVHMKHLGHTLFNDARYGGDKILKGTIYSRYKQFIDNCFTLFPRPALHAATLGFTHPVSGKRMFFEQPLPAEFKELLEKWRKYWAALQLRDDHEETN